MEMKKSMKSIAFPHSLKMSIAWIIGLNILIFLFLGISINRMSERTIENIGTAYMAEMNEQISLHFETVIDLRLTIHRAYRGGRRKFQLWLPGGD